MSEKHSCIVLEEERPKDTITRAVESDYTVCHQSINRTVSNSCLPSFPTHVQHPPLGIPMKLARIALFIVAVDKILQVSSTSKPLLPRKDHLAFGLKDRKQDTRKHNYSVENPFDCSSPPSRQTFVRVRGGGPDATLTKTVLQRIICLLLWACPVWFYVKGYPLTQKFVKCLKAMEKGECIPYLEQWEAIEKIGGVPGVLSHIKWGSPSVALYLLATLFFFPLNSLGNFSQKAGALFIIPAGLSLARSLGGGFQVIAALFSHPDSEGLALTIATIFLVLTTLPFLQLISWQIEYGLRTLLNCPGKTVLPNWFLTVVSKTNILRLFYKLMKQVFNLSFLPKGYRASGEAAVNSIIDADYYSSSSNASQLKAEHLKAINTGLLVQVMYGSLAIIPMWAVLTDFGIFPVKYSTPASRCIWSKLWLKFHPSHWNPADFGISGMLGPYWILSFLWLLWGVAISWLSQ